MSFEFNPKILTDLVRACVKDLKQIRKYCNISIASVLYDLMGASVFHDKKSVNCLCKCIFKAVDNMVDNLLTAIEQLIPVQILINLTIISLVSFFASLVIIPVILVRLPHDYFDTRKTRHWLKDHHPFLRILGLIIKNVSGSAFVIAGFIMLFLPGQGILTMLIGLSLMDFPKKRQLEIKIIRQPTVLKTINTLRHKYNKLPLTLS